MAFLKKNIIPFYFLFSVLDYLLSFFGFASIAKFSLLYLIGSLIVIVYTIPLWRKFDYFLLFFISFISIVSIINSPHPLLLKEGLRYQLLLTIFFYLGRYCINDNKLFEIGKPIVLIIAIISVALYFFKPGWYVTLKMSLTTLDTTSDVLYYEIMRLTGFSAYPYWISYASCIFFVYNIAHFVSLQYKQTLFDYFCMAILFLTMFLSEQRAPLFISLFYAAVILAHSLFSQHSVRLTMKTVAIVIIIASVSMPLINKVDTNQRGHISEKLESVIDGKKIFVEQRTNAFVLSNKDISIFGDGVGTYSHAAIQLNRVSIADQQYLRILYETGIIGLGGYLLVFLFVLLHGIRNARYFIFEIGVVLFYLFSMLGANSLSQESYHTAVFWICCGRILNSRYYTHHKNV